MKKTARHPAVVDLLGGTHGALKERSREVGAQDGPSRPPRRARRAYLAAGVVAIASVGVVVTQIVSGESEVKPVQATEESSQAPVEAAPESIGSIPLTPSPTQTATESNADECRTDPGDQKSGPGVIAAFEHAYYVARSGDAARALATPESPLPQGAAIQSNGIDTVPVGTTHCVRVTPIGTGVYSVVLAEMRPGQPPVQFPQTITTKEVDGRWFIDVIR